MVFLKLIFSHDWNAMLTVGRALGLVLLGFILGVIVSGLKGGDVLYRTDPLNVGSSSTQPVFSNDIERDYTLLAETPKWRIVMPKNGEGNQVALFQHGQLRINIVDDDSSLYVTTHKDGSAVWEGRLMDVGNDGSIEVADISNGHCEKF